MLSVNEVLRDSAFRRIFLLSVLMKFGFLYFLPRSPLALAPDEGVYSQITLWFSNGNDLSNSATRSIGLYESSRSLIIPAGILCKLGVQSLYSVRITSVIYGLLSILIFMTLILNFTFLKNSYRPKRILQLRLFTVLVFIFLPSHFLWSELGLRESASEFWILLSAFLLLKIYVSLEKINFYYYALLTVSLVLAFGSRKQTAMVFIFALFLAQVLTRINKKTFMIFGSLFLAGALGFLFVSTPAIEVTKIYHLEPINPLVKYAASAKSCFKSDQNVKVGQDEFICKLQKKIVKKYIFSKVIAQIPSSDLDNLQTQFELNRANAESALPESKCSQQRDSNLDLYLCLAKELPYRAGSFLFRPLFPFDSGSYSYNLASFENYFWLSLTILLLLSLYQLIGQLNYRYELNFVYIYIVGFIVGSAIYEGNLGTAFRHKSSILWCLLLITYVCIQNLYASKLSNTVRK